MTKLRALWMRARATSTRRRASIVAGVCAVGGVFVVFAVGATDPVDPATLAGDAGREASRTFGGADGGTTTAAERARKKAAAADGDAEGGGSGSGEPLAAGVKPGKGIDNLLKNLGVPKKRDGPGAKQVSTPVTIGIDYQEAGAANSFFRAYGVDAGAADPASQAQAVAEWINQRGGIGGRRLELQMRRYDFYRERLSVLDAATCNVFSKAIADVDRHASTDILIPCLAKKGVPTFVNAQSSPAIGDFNRYPGLLYSSGSAAIDRPQGAYIRGLKAAGFFARGTRVGVLRSTGLPQLDHAHNALRGALTNEGIKVVADVPVSTEDVASFLVTETNAMLKMRSARVDRIVAVDENGVVLGQFMRNAENQRYRPLYGVNSIASPQFLARETPLRQLRGAIGVGWSPLVDVPGGSDADNPVRDQCDQIFRAFKVAVGDRTPFGHYTAYHVCDSVLLIAAAVAQSGDASVGGLRRGIDKVGPRWTSPLALGTSLGNGRADGAARWRMLRFGDDCRCFRYDGPEHSF